MTRTAMTRYGYETLMKVEAVPDGRYCHESMKNYMNGLRRISIMCLLYALTTYVVSDCASVINIIT